MTVLVEATVACVDTMLLLLTPILCVAVLEPVDSKDVMVPKPARFTLPVEIPLETTFVAATCEASFAKSEAIEVLVVDTDVDCVESVTATFRRFVLMDVLSVPILLLVEVSKNCRAIKKEEVGI